MTTTTQALAIDRALSPTISKTITSVRLMYPDLHGVARGKDVPASEFEHVIEHGLGAPDRGAGGGSPMGAGVGSEGCGVGVFMSKSPRAPGAIASHSGRAACCPLSDGTATRAAECPTAAWRRASDPNGAICRRFTGGK